MRILASIRISYPGLDPSEMTWPQLRELCEVTPLIAAAKAGERNHRAEVQRMNTLRQRD